MKKKKCWLELRESGFKKFKAAKIEKTIGKSQQPTKKKIETTFGKL